MQPSALFNPPIIQPLEDERILENVRDHLATNRLLDSIFHPADNHLYISQAGGIIHQYDPRTHLWNTQQPFPNHTLTSANFVLLRSGCGDASDSIYLKSCPDSRSLWALSDDGSLARFDGETWGVVIANTQFQGQDGKLVQNDDLSAAALSDDQTWLLLGTHSGNIGIYNSRSHQWLPPNSIQGQLPTGQIVHMVWWRGYFWVGTADALFRVQINGEQAISQFVLQSKGLVIDLDADADPEGRLWVLEKRTCGQSNPTQDCVWLGTLSNPDQSFQIVLDEAHHFSNLNLGSLIFAQQINTLLTLAGSAGIYTYDTQIHNWNRIFQPRVLSTLPFDDNQGFYFTDTQGVHVVRAGKLLNNWTLGESVAQLLYGKSNQELLALTQSGNLFSVDPQSSSTTPTLVHQQGATALDPAHFTSSVSVGNSVVFTGPDGVLLHDVQNRTYNDFSGNNAPPWLLLPGTKLWNSGGNIYGVSNSNIYTVPGTRFTSPDYFSSREALTAVPLTVNSPIHSAWTLGNDGLGVIAGDGSLYLAEPDKLNPMTGPAVPELSDAPLRDVTQNGNSFVAIVGNHVERYDLTSRTWTALNISTSSGENPEELVDANGRLLIRTSAGRLLDDQGKAILGDNQDLDFSDNQLSDVLNVNTFLYLAGNGHISKYDLNARQIDNSWLLASSGDVRLSGIIDDKPLSLGNGQAFLGTQSLTSTASTVTNLSYDTDFIWTVQKTIDNLFLMGFDRNAPTNADQTQCYFRNPTAGKDVKQVLDARLLPNNTVTVLTNAGVRFYSPAGRTWYSAPTQTPSADRVYYIKGNKDYLLLVTHLSNGLISLSFIKVENIEIPDSCSISTATFPITETETVRAVSVNETKSGIAWIGNDGSVTTWQDGQKQNIIGVETGAPASETLLRVFDRQLDGYLLFTTSTNIWRYDLNQRVWASISLTFPAGSVAIANIDIQTNQKDNIVTIQSVDQKFFYGTLTATASSVSLKPILDMHKAQPTGVTPDTLLDMQKRIDDDKIWIIVLNNVIRYFDPANRTWFQSDIFPPDNTFSFGRSLGRGVLVGNGGKSWWVAQTTDAHPRHFVNYPLVDSDQQTALGFDGHVWRLSAGGEVSECVVTQVNAQQQYVCNPVRIPFILKPEDVLHAFEWEDWVIFETSKGLRAFDKDKGEETPLPQPAVGFSRVTAAYAPTQDQLFLYDGDSDQLLLFSPAGIMRIDSTLDLLLDDKQTLWAQFPDGWQYFDGSQFASPVIMNSVTAKQASVRLFAKWNSQLTGIGPDGKLYFWDGHNLIPSARSFSPNIDPAHVDNLLVDTSDAWWVFSDQSLKHLVAEECVSADQPYPVSTLNAVITSTASAASTAAAASTLTPAPSQTPSPTLTALPPTNPCYYEIGEITLPSTGRIVSSGILPDGVQIIDENGQIVQVTNLGAGQYSLTTQTATSLPAFGINSDWDNLRQFLNTLPNGQIAYDPITKLTLDDKKQLSAHRFSGLEQTLNTTAAFPAAFEIPPALDVGWLRWNRDTQTFTVSTNNAKQDFSRQDFIQDNEFLFEKVDSLLVNSDSEFQAANAHGLWVYTQPDLNLNDGKIVFYPASLNQPITAAHGYFLAGSEMVHLDTGKLLREPLHDVVFNLGNVQFTEHVQIPSVEVILTTSDGSLNALASNGFLWDFKRQSLAYLGTNLLLQSAAGIHPLNNQYTNFNLAPSRLALTSGVLQSDSAGAAYLLDTAQGEWYSYDGSAWNSKVIDPQANRTLFQNSTWEWVLQNGQLNVALGGVPYGFAILSQNGLGFNADHLLAATSYANSLYVASDAFLEIASPAQQISGFQANRIDPITVDRLETYTFSDGSSNLYRYDKNAVFRWDVTTRHFVSNAPAPDPEIRRSLVELPHLRFTRDANHITKEILTDDLVGSPSWVTYNFYNGHFPFDYVTGVTNFDQQLNVGTVSGLETYPINTFGPLSSLLKLYDLHSLPSGTLAPVTDMGIPADDPTLLIVQSNAVCIERRASQPFSLCLNAALLNAKLRLSSNLWRWIASNREIIGNYFDVTGNLDAEPINMTQGRLPHDRISEATTCQGKFFTAWDGRWITVYPDGTLALHASIQNYRLDELTLLRFICVPVATQLDSILIPVGTYFETQDHQLLVYDANSWKPITNPALVDTIRSYADNPPIFESDRLRLRRNDQKFEFEHLGQDGHWLPLPWLANSITGTWTVGIDLWEKIVMVGDQMWAATPLGLVTVERPSRQVTQFDPKTVELVREPLVDQSVCQITDLKWLNNHVFVRCSADSKQVFEGDLSALRPTGVFTLYSDSDPFAAEVQISAAQSGYWEWQLTGRQRGSPGNLELSLGSEHMSLENGQFDFDSITSVALFRDGLVEVASERAGWFQSSRDGLPVSSLKRPTDIPDAANFKTVGITHDGTKPLLCLEGENKTYLRLDKDMTSQQSASCPEYEGRDGLWLYLQLGAQLNITAPTSIGGQAQRLLSSGRFMDDIAIGLPITGLSGGKPAYWLPTRGGVLEMTNDFHDTNLHVGSFSGLNANEIPTLLYMYQGRIPSYFGFVGGTRVYRLDASRTAITNNLWSHEGAVTIQAVDNGPDGLLRIRWSDDNGDDWSDVGLAAAFQTDDTLNIQVEDFNNYHYNEQALLGIRPEISGRIAPEHMTFTMGTLKPYLVDIPAGFKLVESVSFGDRVLLIGQHDLYEINLETLITNMVAQKTAGN